MSSADGFVLCSKETKDGDREGVPTVLMEAQAIGMPVVSTCHSGIPEVIPEPNRYLLADEGDVKGISEQLCRVARMKSEELREVTQRGRERIESEFSLSKEAKKLKNIYNNIGG